MQSYRYTSYHSLFLVQLDYNLSLERNTAVHPEKQIPKRVAVCQGHKHKQWEYKLLKPVLTSVSDGSQQQPLLAQSCEVVSGLPVEPPLILSFSFKLVQSTLGPLKLHDFVVFMKQKGTPYQSRTEQYNEWELPASCHCYSICKTLLVITSFRSEFQQQPLAKHCVSFTALR